jgi:hypothetical protein
MIGVHPNPRVGGFLGGLVPYEPNEALWDGGSMLDQRSIVNYIKHEIGFSTVHIIILFVQF